jgi:hypothetical protein
VQELEATREALAEERAAVAQAVDALGERAREAVEGAVMERAAGAMDRAAAVTQAVLGAAAGEAPPERAGGEAAGGGAAPGEAGAGERRA